MVMADVLRPAFTRKWSIAAYEVAVIVGGAVFTAFLARVSIPLPFSPVPITGQTLAVLFVGALLGARRSTLSMVLYLGWGILGLPVFAGGTGGISRLAGPTGGYLIGFVFAAWTTGALAQRGWDRGILRCAVAMALGNLTIYLFGLPWLGAFVGMERAIALGFLPFISGDVVKLSLAAILLPAGWRALRRFDEGVQRARD